MVLIKVDEEIDVQSLFQVSELVIILHLYWKENLDTLSIDVINQILMCVHVIDDPLQEFYVGEHWSSTCHHVQVRSSNILKNFIVDLSHMGVVV